MPESQTLKYSGLNSQRHRAHTTHASQKPPNLAYATRPKHLSKLMATITQGWPDDRKQLPHPLRAYWTYRDELTTEDGLIYKGAQVMIPQSMQAEMLLKIHANHFGPESNVRMAREVLFWPGMRQAVLDMCNNCSTCAQYGSKSTKEPMRSLPIPTLPWQIISQDIFMHRQYGFKHTTSSPYHSQGNS